MSRALGGWLATLALALITLCAATAHAAPAGCSPTTKLYFGNGVANTRLDAQQSMWSLVPLAEEAGLADFQVDLAYNPTDGMLLDVVQTLKQKIAEDSRFSWYLANNILGYTLRGLTIPKVIARKHAPLIEAIQGYVNDAIATANSHPAAFYDSTVAEHVSQYGADLSAGHRVLLVAHSQGNLYANSAYGLLHAAAPGLAHSFGIVAVGTAAETSLNGYVTSDNDLVIGLLRTLGKTVLPSNVHVPVTLGDLSGHTFLNTYLEPSLPARARVASLLTKVADDVPFRSAICAYEDGKLTAFLGTGEEQSYSFQLAAGQTAYFRVSEVDQTTFWPGIYIADPLGVRVGSTQGTDVAGMHITASSSGKYTVIISDASATRLQPGAYELYWAMAPGANEGGSLASGGVVTDTIDQGDLDSYTFSALAGEGIMLRVSDVDATGLWPGVTVYGPTGELADTGYGVDVAGLEFAAESSGTYTVIVYDDSSSFGSTGAYALYFTRAPSANEGGRLITDVIVSDTIARGDLDSYTFDADAGDGIMLRMADVDSSGLWPGINVYDPSGALADDYYDPDVGGVDFVAASSGVYTVVLYDAASGFWNTGAYDLYLTRAPGANELGELSPGVPASGTIDKGDLDSYVFSSLAGMDVTVHMTDTQAGALWPGVRVYHPSGAVTTTYGVELAETTFLTKSSGLYTLVAYDASAHSNGSGAYSLSFSATPHVP